MQTITSHTFEQFLQSRRILPATAAALRRVMVNGESPATVSSDTGVARSALYRLVKAFHTARPGDVVVTASCPAHHAETLRGLIAGQVAKWRQADAMGDEAVLAAMAQNPGTPPSAPATKQPTESKP